MVNQKLMLDALNSTKRMVNGDRLLQRIPSLAISGDDMAVDQILYEVLHLLVDEIQADVGQINLLPKGGRVEKVCIIKDGELWLKKGLDLHLFDPYRGFTGRVVATRSSVLVNDIWAKGTEAESNPFLELVATMDERYVRELKEPVASIIIAPIKRGQDVFCTIELSRYRGRDPFCEEERGLIDDFARRYGALVMDYILDVKNRVAINIAHKKLLSISRLISSKKPVDYRDAVEAYIKMSAADTGLLFLKTASLQESNYLTLVWHGEEIRTVFLRDFSPSRGSILRDDPEVSFHVEGEEGDPRLTRFYARIQTDQGLTEEERGYVLKCLGLVKSYVAYPLHLLGQDLGAVVLGSRRPRFWQFLHMNPFLSLYNSLLKSFLLNERVIHYLSNVSLKIHNPGFYCLAALKGSLISKHPETFHDPEVTGALNSLEHLLNELHDQGKLLRSRDKNLLFVKWLRAFIGQKSAQMSGLEISLEIKGRSIDNCLLVASKEELETIFENLFSNSIRAISTRQRDDALFIGMIRIKVWQEEASVRVRLEDNGASYPTVSGRGIPQIRSLIRNLGGNIRRYKKPYRVFLDFPFTEPTEEGKI